MSFENCIFEVTKEYKGHKLTYTKAATNTLLTAFSVERVKGRGKATSTDGFKPKAIARHIKYLFDGIYYNPR